MLSIINFFRRPPSIVTDLETPVVLLPQYSIQSKLSDIDGSFALNVSLACMYSEYLRDTIISPNAYITDFLSPWVWGYKFIGQCSPYFFEKHRELQLCCKYLAGCYPLLLQSFQPPHKLDCLRFFPSHHFGFLNSPRTRCGCRRGGNRYLGIPNFGYRLYIVPSAPPDLLPYSFVPNEPGILPDNFGYWNRKI